MRVFVHGCAATPLALLEALAKHGVKAKLKDVELIHIHTEGPGICVQPQYEGIVSIHIPYIHSLLCQYWQQIIEKNIQSLSLNPVFVQLPPPNQ